MLCPIADLFFNTLAVSLCARYPHWELRRFCSLPQGTGQEKEEKEEEVSTNEDLMREHGILKRVLLAYDEIIRRIRVNKDFPPQAATDGATIIRKFIEDYHERLEEDHLFPRFRKAGKLVSLVDSS